MIHEDFNDWVKPHLESLYNTGLRMTRNEADTQDLVQETLYKAYKSIKQFQKDTNFKAWIFRIMVNTYITAYRKASKQPQKVSYNELEEFYLYKKMEESFMQHALSVGRPSAFDSFFDDDVKTALDNLPEQFRSVVLLCDIESFSYNEISKILNTPLGTVMSRLFRGRKLLQKSLLKYAKERGIISDHSIKH
jgi:RNA polymerase sigma-70 factor, ECF subfamily